MKIGLVLALVIVAVATTVVPLPAQAISLVERGDNSGWVVTAPRADQAGDSLLPPGFSEQTRNALDTRVGIVLIVLMVAGLALAAYTVHVAFAGHRVPRRP